MAAMRRQIEALRAAFRETAHNREAFALKQQRHVDEMTGEGLGNTFWCQYVTLGIAVNRFVAEVCYALAGGRAKE